jgi:hypothetical protein
MWGLQISQSNLTTDPDAVQFDNEQPASVILRIGMSIQVRQRPVHEPVDDFRAVVELNGNDPLIVGWRIGHDVRKIDIQG